METPSYNLSGSTVRITAPEQCKLPLNTLEPVDFTSLVIKDDITSGGTHLMQIRNQPDEDAVKVQWTENDTGEKCEGTVYRIHWTKGGEAYILVIITSPADYERMKIMFPVSAIEII